MLCLAGGRAGGSALPGALHWRLQGRARTCALRARGAGGTGPLNPEFGHEPPSRRDRGFAGLTACEAPLNLTPETGGRAHRPGSPPILSRGALSVPLSTQVARTGLGRTAKTCGGGPARGRRLRLAEAERRGDQSCRQGAPRAPPLGARMPRSLHIGSGACEHGYLLMIPHLEGEGSATARSSASNPNTQCVSAW